MKELVVISGKGGTGKTSIVASLAALARRAVLADCDVDAADLYLILEPQILSRGDFSGGSRARVCTDECAACGRCRQLCRFGAISDDGPGNGAVDKTYRVDPIACEGCGVCAWFCPAHAIELKPATNGEWFLSETRHGPMAHAKLGVAEENSGKLVSLVRQHAKQLADERKLDLVLIDGPPGIGCPVIASIAGADLVLVITEPTLSGLHDLHRVADLTKHFGIDALVCINKHDLNAEIAGRIEAQTRQRGLRLVAKIRYDPAVTKAQVHKQAVVEYAADGAAADIRQVWDEVCAAMDVPRRRLRGSPAHR